MLKIFTLLLFLLVAFFTPTLAMESGESEEGDTLSKLNISDSLNGLSNSVKANSAILVIDDNKLNLIVMRGMLKELGYSRVTLADSGQGAIEIIKNNAKEKVYFDVIFTDINMPGMDGIDCTREIRKIPHMESALIIAVTTEVGIKEKGFESGINDFMPKPFTKALLKNALSKIDNLINN